jgi:hypothetical protein
MKTAEFLHRQYGTPFYICDGPPVGFAATEKLMRKLCDILRYVFRSYFDMPVGAYVRRAALRKAASDILCGELRYFFGYVSTSDEVPNGFVQMNVPAAEYAVFDVPPISHDIHGGEKLALEIRKTWKYIFKEWLDANAYLFDESKLCFEFYHGEETKVYVPVKAK